MAKTKVWISPSGARKIRESAPMRTLLRQRAEAIAESAEGFGGYWEATVHAGRGRAVATVVAADYDAVVANSEQNSLLKSIDAGKGDA
ncbi:MAG: hypothetical protein LBP28_05605 [Coriobacteriales bacterium]|jgi:outer membrane lipoprotein SlyB|nr:hypothetical protein [Coriobacteriales bacterium]